MLARWLDSLINEFCNLFPRFSFFSFDFNVRGLLAVVLVSLACGAVGALVVSNRMAFFADALAHCAFAGVGLGFLIALARGVQDQSEFQDWITPIMVGFGILVGLGIAWVRDRSGLSADTVIGVFFAGAVGFGAILLKFVARRKYFNPETFLFGDLLTVRSGDLVLLLILLLITAAVLALLYNDLVLASFNPSLALSRRVRVKLCNFAFIALLAVIVNLCLQTVGALLINAMLVVPAATASNVSRNLRQLFWVTIVICLVVGLLGEWIAWNLAVVTSQGQIHDESFGIAPGGAMVVLSVLLFFVSLPVGRFLQNRRKKLAA